ncbi:hypothetical protein GFS60_07088 (plasmid) [Rhodococcus sp. WAY2]|nr:hypothetical protein GFS60_07088 [Rhodococcus sp. WAY2]
MRREIGVRMKLVMVGVDEKGRSFVRSESSLSVDEPHTLWFGGVPSIRSALARLDPGAALSGIEPEAGDIRWRLAVVEAGAVASLPEMEDAFDDDGMHYTRTADFDFVVAGEVVCRLDTADIELAAGDAIVLPAARHAWIAGEVGARILCFMVRPHD